MSRWGRVVRAVGRRRARKRPSAAEQQLGAVVRHRIEVPDQVRVFSFEDPDSPTGRRDE